MRTSIATRTWGWWQLVYTSKGELQDCPGMFGENPVTNDPPSAGHRECKRV